MTSGILFNENHIVYVSIETNPAARPENQEIDLADLARYLWQRRFFVLKWAAAGLLAGIVIAFSLPKEYESAMKLTPENAEKPKAGQLGTLAALAGVQVGSGSSGDAMSVDLYPDIVASLPFLLELADVPVTDRLGRETTCYDYLVKQQKSPWWNGVLGLPFRLVGWIKGGSDPVQASAPDLSKRPVFLTAEQERYLAALKERIAVQVDKKNGTIQAVVRMQDPYIAAWLVETIVTNLQTYITGYRTKKAKEDLAFSEKLYKESRETYYRAQTAYARYTDENNYTASVSGNVEKIRLQQEMNLAYDVFSQMARQWEAGKIKVQEQTPVYAVIEPARIVPAPASPRKLLWIGGLTAFFTFFSLGWLIVVHLINENKAVAE